MRRSLALLVTLATVTSLGATTVQAGLQGNAMNEAGRTVDGAVPDEVPHYDRVREVLRTIQAQGQLDPGRVRVLTVWVDVEAGLDPCMESEHLLHASAAAGASDPDLGPYPDEPVSYEPDQDGGPEMEHQAQMPASEIWDPWSGGDDEPLDDPKPEERADGIYEGLWRTGGDGWRTADGVTFEEDASTEDGPDGVATSTVDPQDRTDPCRGEAPQSDDGTEEVNASGVANDYKDAWVGEICGWKGWGEETSGVRVAVGGSKLPERAHDEAPCVVLQRTDLASAGIGWSLRSGESISTTRTGVRPAAAEDLTVDPAGEPGSLAAGLVEGFAAADRMTPAVPGVSPLVKAIGYGLALLSLAAFALYRRLTEEDVLDNDLRLRMLEIAEADPGIAASRIAEELDVAVTTVLYHGRVLAETGHLVSKRSGGRVVFFATDQAETVLERELVCAMKRAGKRDLIELLADDPGLNLSEAARRLDRNRSTIKRHADDLVEVGLVVDDRQGRSRTLSLDPQARAIVADR